MKTATKSMKVYTVDRKKWRRGQGAACSKMWDEEKQCGCCLGLVGLQCGYTRKQLDKKSTPKSVLVGDPEMENLFPEGLLNPRLNSRTAFMMMAVNDAVIGKHDNSLVHPKSNRYFKITSEKYRERKLRELAMSIGFRLKFVG